MAKIGLAKRQKTVRQKGKIRTDTNHPISFQEEVLERAEVNLQNSGGRKKRKVFRRRNLVRLSFKLGRPYRGF